MSMPDASTASPSRRSEQFRAGGYTVVRHVISVESAQLGATYALLQQQYPGYYEREDMFGAAVGRYADTLGESLLLELKPAVQEATGLELLPCYSYLRIYGHGALLPRHLDRPACEISTSLTLGFKSAALWPLHLTAVGADQTVELETGDMLIYRGADLPHWRERFAGEYWVQAFLHYVDAQGQYTDFRFDGRDRIGPFDKLTMRRNRERPASLGQRDRMATVGPGAPCPCGSGLRFRDCHGRGPNA